MYYLVYITTNLINGKIYVGVHSTLDPNDNYFGSGKALNSSIKKYGIINFKKEILYYCLSMDHAHEIEKNIVDLSFIKRQDTYNMNVGGHGSFTHINTGPIHPRLGKKHSEETRKKLSYPKTKEHRKKLSEANLGKRLTSEQKKKLSEAQIGHKKKPESSKNYSAANLRRSKEFYEALGKKSTGTIQITNGKENKKLSPGTDPQPWYDQGWWRGATRRDKFK